ncbi:MAG: helix-turn-helix domain-containing protein [Ruminococcus callidus]
MTFSELLNEYICIFRCTAGELANASGLTQASLSRYRNGQRMPETDTLKNLRPESLALQRRTAQIWILIWFSHSWQRQPAL